MAKRVLLCLSHSIEEYDQLRLLSGLGYDVASIGGYIDPHHPHDPKRPALDIPFFPEVKEAVDAQDTDDNLGAAQACLPDELYDWLGADGIIIYHHYLDRLYGQWDADDRLDEFIAGGGRVIWRTVGQSTEHNEVQAAPYRARGMEIVRYSPRERNLPGFAGEDVMIRFYKDPDEWTGWHGDEKLVTNITQNFAQRNAWCNYEFFARSTANLPTIPYGPGSEAIGGPGEVSLDEMKDVLRRSRAYLYTGTQPASYTLGLIEALMTGIPVVSIGPSWMTLFPYSPDLFEGHLLTGAYSDLTSGAELSLRRLLEDDELAATFSLEQRRRAVEGFGMEGVGAAWREYLGSP